MYLQADRRPQKPPEIVLDQVVEEVTARHRHLRVDNQMQVNIGMVEIATRADAMDISHLFKASHRSLDHCLIEQFSIDEDVGILAEDFPGGMEDEGCDEERDDRVDD